MLEDPLEAVVLDEAVGIGIEEAEVPPAALSLMVILTDERAEYG